MHKSLLLLKKIPRGKVTTYKSIAKACNTSPRAVGSMMRSNKHPDLYPCYKVVLSSGKIGGYCKSTSGENIEKKIRLLRRDGVKVKNGRIDLGRFMHEFSA